MKHPTVRAGARLAGILLAVALGSGCATTAKISQFQTFAQVGTQYSQALDGLLETSGQILVDTNSQKLLENRELTAVSREQFQRQDQAMRANLSEIALLRRQVSVLAQYFETLANLATSQAPEVFATQVEATVTSLDGISQQLRQRDLARNEEAVRTLAGGVGELVVRRVQLGALSSELRRRKQTIAEALLLHESLLQALRAQVGADLQFVADRKYEDEVEGPFLGTGSLDAQTWMTRRRTLLAQPKMIDQLEAAIQAAGKLRQAWVKLLSRDLTPADLGAIAAEVEPILVGLDALEAGPVGSMPPSSGDSGGN